MYIIRGDNKIGSPQLCKVQYTKHSFHGFTVMIENGVLEKHTGLHAQLDGDLAEINR